MKLMLEISITLDCTNGQELPKETHHTYSNHELNHGKISDKFSSRKKNRNMEIFRDDKKTLLLEICQKV